MMYFMLLLFTIKKLQKVDMEICYVIHTAGRFIFKTFGTGLFLHNEHFFGIPHALLRSHKHLYTMLFSNLEGSSSFLFSLESTCRLANGTNTTGHNQK